MTSTSRSMVNSLGRDEERSYFFDLRLGATLVTSLLPPPAVFDRGIDVLLAATSAGV